MTQPTLFPIAKPFKRKIPHKESVEDVRKKARGPNEVAADIILGDVEKYQEGSLPVVWARLFQTRQQERETNANRPTETEIPRI